MPEKGIELKIRNSIRQRTQSSYEKVAKPHTETRWHLHQKVCDKSRARFGLEQEDRQPHEGPVSVQTGPAHIYTTQQTTIHQA